VIIGLQYTPIPKTDYARVTFAADVEGIQACDVARASSIVHDKISNWARAWCPSEVVARDVVPRVSMGHGRTRVELCAVIPMSAVRDCRAECCLG
jgi:hypothetical protein